MRAGDLMGAILNETQLPRDVVGRIEIAFNVSFVEIRNDVAAGNSGAKKEGALSDLGEGLGFSFPLRLRTSSTKFARRSTSVVGS